MITYMFTSYMFFPSSKICSEGKPQFFLTPLALQ